MKVHFKSNPYLPVLLVIVLSLLVFFAFSLARRQTASPSEGISREIIIGELDYGFSKTINSHIHLLPVPGSETVTVFAVDGAMTQMIDLNVEGEILGRRTVDLDLAESSLVEASYTSAENIRVFYKKRVTLHQMDIDLSGSKISGSVIARKIRSFSSDGELIVFQKEEGLFGRPAGSPREPHTVEQFLMPGEFSSFKIKVHGDNVFILAVEKTDWDSVNIHLLNCDRDFRLIRKSVILKNGRLKYYKDLKDIFLHNNMVTALYSYRDKHDKLNRLTFQTIDAPRGRLESEIQNDFPYYNSRYSIVDNQEGVIRFLLQFDGRHNVDLGLCTMESDESYRIDPLSRTRNVSKLAGYTTLDGYKTLVFSDLEYDRRILHFASGAPVLIGETTRLGSLSFSYPLLITVLAFLVSLVSGILFLMAVLPLPFTAMLLIDRLHLVRGASLFYLFTVAAGAVHTGIQILISLSLLNSRIDTRFFPVFAGEELWISMTLILVSLMSYAAAHRDMKGEEYVSRSLMTFYIKFGVYNYIIYVPLFLMYVFNAVLLSKI